MYEVLNIQEVTEEKELVNANVQMLLNRSSKLNNSGMGPQTVNRSMKESQNPANFLSFNSNDLASNPKY